MRVAVLGSATSWYVSDLQRAAGDEHEVVPITYRHLTAHVDGQRLQMASGEADLLSFDALLVRSMPPGSLEQVIFRMNALAQLDEAGVKVVNSPRSIEIAVDKYLTTAKLQAAGLRVPATATCQTWEQAMESFERLGCDVVVKPLFGGEGRGITRVSLHDETRLDDEAIAQRVFKTLEQIGAVIYLQKFIEHEGCDLRVLLIGDQTLGMRRRHPADWRTNISLGAKAEPLEVTPELAALARRASEAIGTTVAGVDFLPGKDGQLYAIEVNAVPGWKALRRVTDRDVGRLVLQHIAAAL